MRLPTIRVTAAVLLLAVALAATAASVQAQEHPKQAAFEAEERQAPAAPTASELLKKGTVSLTTGRFADAISHFDAAIELEPENYLSYYRRATASLSLGRSSSALSDFDRILKLNPKFSQAHFQRAKLLAREGELADASESIKEYLKAKKDDEEAKALQKTIEGARANLKALRKAKESVDKSIAAGKPSSSVSGKLDDCMRYASLIVDASPSLLEARRARADCALFKGDVQDAMADWTRIAHLSPSPPLLLRLSALSYYVFGERSSQGRDAGLAHLKTCLNSDPDNKACAKAHRRVRALEKSLKKATNFAEASSWRAALSALKGAKVGGPTVMDDVTTAIQEGLKPAKEGEESVIPSTLHDAIKRSALLFELNEVHCRAHMELGEIKKAMPYCTKVLERDEDNKFARVARGEEHMAADRLEEAVRDLRKAFELSGNSDASIHARLQKAEKRLKLSKSKDYYKVLGVARDADDKTMKKAYRAKAREHHPDKGGSPEKMAEINEAFDVLKDKEKRARFDAGDDPNDPMGGHPGGQGNPFAQGFDPRHQFFQGGGANFFQSSGQRFEFKFG